MNRSEATQLVIRCYPTMSVGEIAARYGLDRSAVAYIVRKHHLAHTPDTVLRLRRKVVLALAASLTPESRRKRSERLRHVWAVERFRLMSGLPPKTRFRPATLPRRVSNALYRLRRRYDYFSDTSVATPLTLFYDSLTTRCPSEQCYTTRYGIVFLPADDEGDAQQQPDKT